MRSAFLFTLTILTVATFLFFLTPSTAMEKGNDLMNKKPENYPSAVFAGGCFWCMESEFRAIDGVLFTRSGYMGGDVNAPSYRDVTTGKSGHAEVVEVTYDPEKTNYKDLLTFFMTRAHDPTQLNRQGVDVGTQYRSAVFYKDEEQKQLIETVFAKLENEKTFKNPIVTTIEPLQTFWEAEGYHQQYYEKYEEKTGQPHLRVLLKMKKKELLRGSKTSQNSQN